MTDMDIMQAQIMLRADFLRASPEYKKPRPGTMIRTMAEAMRIYAWSPDWYHWLRLMTSIAVEEAVSQTNGEKRIGQHSTYLNRRHLVVCH